MNLTLTLKSLITVPVDLTEQRGQVYTAGLLTGFSNVAFSILGLFEVINPEF